MRASVTAILTRLSRNISVWVILSNIIAWPIAWYFMDEWLQNFAYRIEPGIGSFIFAGILTLIIALFTTGYISVKAALTNPVEALKYE